MLISKPLQVSLFVIACLLVFPILRANSMEKKQDETAEQWAVPDSAMPLGRKNLAQTQTVQPLTDGVTFYQIKRGVQSKDDFWTVNIGFYSSQSDAQSDSIWLDKAGFTTRLDRSAGTDKKGQLLGYYLSVGKYPTQKEAKCIAGDIHTASAGKFNPELRHTSLAGNLTTGPWIVNVLAVNPAITQAKLTYELPGGNNLGGVGETVTAAAQRVGAIAGLNAGFFSNINPFKTPFPPRSPVGTTVVHGSLVSSASGNRPGVMITETSSGHPQVAFLQKLTTETLVSDKEGYSVMVKGINRPILGTVINCGSPAEKPVSEPQQDVICTNFNDLVMYDALYLQGKSANTLINADYHGPVFELRVSQSGKVISGQERLGAPIPPRGYVLQGLGSSIKWLKAHATPGTQLNVKSQVYADGKLIYLPAGSTIVEAGPTLTGNYLLKNAWAEGFSPKLRGFDEGESAGRSKSSWYEGWVVARTSRSAIGTTPHGTILLVEIPGRQPEISIGASIPEMAAIMHWLGAVKAMNLDGGGSSNMVVNGKSVGSPSDTEGERGVAGTFMIRTPN